MLDSIGGASRVISWALSNFFGALRAAALLLLLCTEARARVHSSALDACPATCEPSADDPELVIVASGSEVQLSIAAAAGLDVS